MAAKKAKRPPSKFWITYNPETGKKHGDFLRKSEADEETMRTGLLVAGPYALQECVRRR